jgi:hypothetical protein
LFTDEGTSGRVAEDAELLSEEEDYSAFYPEENSEPPSSKYS